ncbi:MAG: hypothetical protein ABIK25_07160 [Pseudomonadota bacterium]
MSFLNETETNNEDLNQGAFRYGQERFAILLADGSTVYIHAYTIDVTEAGALYAVGQYQEDPNAEPGEMEVVFAVAPANWVHFARVGNQDNFPVAMVI